jgi:hypothetical protein
LGLSKTKITALLVAIEISKQAGPFVAVKGLGARLVVEKLVLAVGGSNNEVIDMEADINKYDWFDTFSKNGGSLPVLAVLDANLSPLDVYGRRLLDYVLSRISETDPPHAHLILSLTDSPLSQPLPKDFTLNTVIVDLDSNNSESTVHTQSPDEVKEFLLDTQEGNLLSSLFWAPLVTRLRRYIDKLSPSSDSIRLRALSSLFEYQNIWRLNTCLMTDNLSNDSVSSESSQIKSKRNNYFKNNLDKIKMISNERSGIDFGASDNSKSLQPVILGTQKDFLEVGLTIPDSRSIMGPPKE